MTFAVSTYSMPFDQQATSLSLRYMQSVYGISVLNETLPQYMTRRYMLAPFEPSKSTTDDFEGRGNYTAPTTMYNMNLSCEDVSRISEPTLELPRWIYYNSSTGCNYFRGLDGNDTLGEMKEYGPIQDVKEYMGRYAGFYVGGTDSWSLEPFCPKTANSTFYAAIAKSKVDLSRLHQENLANCVGSRRRSTSEHHSYILSDSVLATSGLCYRR
jgi:hypothetical protein